MLKKFSFTWLLVLSLTAGCATVGGSSDSATTVSQTLALAESTATAGLVIAVDLSQLDLISVAKLKQVVAANKVVDAAVKAGFAALEIKDIPSALAALQSPEVVNALQELQEVIAKRKMP